MTAPERVKQGRAFSVIGLLIAFAGVYLLRENNYVQNLVFHTNEESTSSTSSNYVRLSSISNSVKESLSQPLGDGVGVAGPASVRNTLRPAHINENYFLQLAEETGIVGVGLFVSTILLIMRQLWVNRKHETKRAMFAIFICLIVINMVSHAWADDTLAYLFFGMVGIVLAAKNSTKSEKNLYT